MRLLQQPMWAVLASTALPGDRNHTHSRRTIARASYRDILPKLTLNPAGACRVVWPLDPRLGIGQVVVARVFAELGFERGDNLTGGGLREAVVGRDEHHA